MSRRLSCLRLLSKYIVTRRVNQLEPVIHLPSIPSLLKVMPMRKFLRLSTKREKLYQVPEWETRRGSGQRRASQIRGGERWRFAMPVPLRTDFDAAAVRALARRTKDGPQARRLLRLAAVYDGAWRTESARIGGVGLQIVRDWVVKFNERGPDGLINGKAPGQPSRLDDAHRAALKAQLEAGPIPAVHGVVRWRLIDLMAWLWEEFRVTISKQTLSRELRAMNYRKLSARPRHHAKSEAAVEAFKKTSSAVWRRSPNPR